MAVAQVLARLRNEPLADCPIATAIEQLCRGCDHLWRDRVLTPAVTLRLFLLQVLHGNTAIAHLRQLSGLAFAPGSYCEARQRLPLEVILGVLGSLVRWANEHVRRDERLIGQGTGGRVLVVDGSSFSTADTPGLRERFGLYPGARPGIGYPMGKLLGRTVEGVRKELAMYLLAYNLVRLAMLRAARAQGATVRRVSFADAARWLCARMLGLEGVETLIVNPPRPGRWEPRVTRSRMKAYDLMVRPRSEMKAAVKTGAKA
jgi:hypothetical protein